MKEDIENIYSKLKEYSKAPPQELWDNIEAKLHPKKNRRGLIWFFGSAAAILILFLGYILIDFERNLDNPIETITDIEYKEQHKSSDQEIVDTDKRTKVDLTKDVDSVSEKNTNFTSASSKVVIQGQELSRHNLEQEKAQNKSRYKYDLNKSNEGEEPNFHEGLVQSDVNTEKIESQNNTEEGTVHQTSEDLIESKGVSKVAEHAEISEEKPKLDISEALANNNIDDDSLTIDIIDKSKWSVAVLGGLANTAATQSTIENVEVNTNSQNDFVYTFKVGYAISDKLTLKSGVGKNVLGQEISNISYVNANSSLAAEVSSQSIVDNSSILFFGVSELEIDAGTFNEFSDRGILEQRFDYIQVPLEISYKFLEKEKYNMSLGVGGNLNFMISNRAFLNNEEIGENIGVNSTIFGATINSNLSFKLTKNTVLFFEPSYNYFQNPVDNKDQNFTNSQLRILFGLQLKL